MKSLSPSLSYIIGFIQGDGTLDRKRISIELKSSDEEILHKIGKELSLNYTILYRDRITNFGPNSSCTLRICSTSLVKKLNNIGIPLGKKSLTIKPPNIEYFNTDYLRGLIDADGSVGMTAQNLPYISLTTASESIKDFVLQFLKDNLQIVKVINRNKRDGVYNITLLRENAQELIKLLYYSNCLSLQRKYQNAMEALRWIRPDGLKHITNVKTWTSEDDLIVLNNDNKAASKILDRSLSSIKNRRWRLNNKG